MRTVHEHFPAFVEQSLLVHLFKRPPHRFCVSGIHGLVCIFKFYPTSYSICIFLPIMCVLHHFSPTSLVELLYPYCFNIFFTLQSHILLNHMLDWQTVRVPTPASAHMVTTHRF